MTVLLRLLALLFAVIFVAFAIANRGPVAVSLSPLPWAFEIPVYLLALFAAVFGAVAGGIGGWRRSSPVRKLAQDRKREVARLQEEIAALHERRRNPGRDKDMPARANSFVNTD